MLKRGAVSIYFMLFSLVIVTIVFLAFIKNANSIAKGEKILQRQESVDIALILDSIEVTNGNIRYEYKKTKGFSYSINENEVRITGEGENKHLIGRKINSDIGVDAAGNNIIIKNGDIS